MTVSGNCSGNPVLALHLLHIAILKIQPFENLSNLLCGLKKHVMHSNGGGGGIRKPCYFIFGTITSSLELFHNIHEKEKKRRRKKRYFLNTDRDRTTCSNLHRAGQQISVRLCFIFSVVHKLQHFCTSPLFCTTGCPKSVQT